MIGFCGAIDFERRAASFSELKRMCGVHSGGVAYVNAELGLLCDSPHDSDKNTLYIGELGDSYLAAVTDADCAPSGERVGGEQIAQMYAEEGADFLRRLSFPFSLAIYDAHRGELMLARGGQGRELFFSEKDGVLYFSPTLRPLIRLWGGCVRVSYERLCEAILSPCGSYPEGLLLDISALAPSEMLIVNCFDRAVLNHGGAEAAEKHVGAQLAEIKDMRHSLSEMLFSRDYPRFECILDGSKKRTLRSAERQIDKVLCDYEGHRLMRDIEPRLNEKSIPLRVKQKGMLAESLMWLDTFNIVLK